MRTILMMALMLSVAPAMAQETATGKQCILAAAGRMSAAESANISASETEDTDRIQAAVHFVQRFSLEDADDFDQQYGVWDGKTKMAIRMAFMDGTITPDKLGRSFLPGLSAARRVVLHSKVAGQDVTLASICLVTMSGVAVAEIPGVSE